MSSLPKRLQEQPNTEGASAQARGYSHVQVQCLQQSVCSKVTSGGSFSGALGSKVYLNFSTL